MAESGRFPAVILAGGLSQRMGSDKAIIPFGRGTLAEHIAERLAPQVSTVSLNAPFDHPLAGRLPLLPDPIPDRPGPLAGVLAALLAAKQMPARPTHVLTTACDTPFLPPDLVGKLASVSAQNAIVMATSAGRGHPVTALWPVTVAEDLSAWLDDPDHRRVFDFIARHPAKMVEFAALQGPFGPVDPFFNINTPDDLAVAQAILDKGDL